MKAVECVDRFGFVGQEGCLGGGRRYVSMRGIQEVVTYGCFELRANGHGEMVAITGPYHTSEGDDRVLGGKRNRRDVIVESHQGVLERDQNRTIFGASRAHG